MLRIVKMVGAPGSPLLLAVGLVVGVAIIVLWPRRRTAGRLWLVAIVSTYLALGLPWTANAIARRLPVVADPTPPSRALDTLIVLHGDNWQGRVRLAAQVFSTSAPRVVWLLGDGGLPDALQEAGIPRTRVRSVPGDLNTRDQMTRVSGLPGVRRAGATAIIASRLHMPRVAALARARGLDLVLLPSPLDTEPPESGPSLFVPTYAALQLSRDALYEHAALAYYRWRRWIT
jgi:uncharacterized SAM-binding protein YcdF (DUF218 family)